MLANSAELPTTLAEIFWVDSRLGERTLVFQVENGRQERHIQFHVRRKPSALPPLITKISFVKRPSVHIAFRKDSLLDECNAANNWTEVETHQEIYEHEEGEVERPGKPSAQALGWTSSLTPAHGVVYRLVYPADLDALCRTIDDTSDSLVRLLLPQLHCSSSAK